VVPPNNTGYPRENDKFLYRHVWRGIRLYHLLLATELLMLIAISFFFIASQNETTTQTAISSYQQSELEIVREAARSTQDYVYEQTVVLHRTDVGNVEQEVYTKFIDPIRLLNSGDAWIYAPDHVVLDMSADFPREYSGKSMAQIFMIQKQYGASHYEEMTSDVTNSREGVGYYVWLPEKGEEIAAWTPVTVGNHTWTVGISTPLPEILDESGASGSQKASLYIYCICSLVAMIIFVAWIRSDIRRNRADDLLVREHEKLSLLSGITRHDINNQLTALKGFIELSRAQATGMPLQSYLLKVQESAEAIEKSILFSKTYEEIGIRSPAWQDVQDCIEKTIPGLVPPGIEVRTDLGQLAIYADPLFEKVIYALFDNTLRHGETVTQITLSHYLTQDHSLVIVYEDNGTGIVPEDKERIFEKGVGKNTGFGLFLAREILTITGMTVQETGSPGKSARFEITVPKGTYRFMADKK
jgi:K+-sensing histidine kinase KdpD